MTFCAGISHTLLHLQSSGWCMYCLHCCLFYFREKICNSSGIIDLPTPGELNELTSKWLEMNFQQNGWKCPLLPASPFMIVFLHSMGSCQQKFQFMRKIICSVETQRLYIHAITRLHNFIIDHDNYLNVMNSRPTPTPMGINSRGVRISWNRAIAR